MTKQKKVKLTPTELELLTSIQKKKEEVSKLVTSLNENESIIVKLVMERVTIAETEVSSIKIEEGSLVFDFKEIKVSE